MLASIILKTLINIGIHQDNNSTIQYNDKSLFPTKHNRIDITLDKA